GRASPEDSGAGLTGPPQAFYLSASPAARMLRAALTSRSWAAPQAHCQVRTFSGIFSCRVPHAEHSLEEGNQRSTTSSSRPYQAHLYSSIERNPRQDASEMARASRPFLTMLRTVRSSITTVWFSRTSRVVILCRKSRRRSVIRAWMRATLRRAFCRFADPLALRDRGRCARASCRRWRRSCRGLVIFSPVERVARAVIPAPTPTLLPVGGSGRIFSSTRMYTNQRPALSRDTVTVDGSAPSGRGRDHTMRKGSLIFANVSVPSR